MQVGSFSLSRAMARHLFVCLEQLHREAFKTRGNKKQYGPKTEKRTWAKGENTILAKSRKYMRRQMLKIPAGHMMWGGRHHVEIHHVAR